MSERRVPGAADSRCVVLLSQFIPKPEMCYFLTLILVLNAEQESFGNGPVRGMDDTVRET